MKEKMLEITRKSAPWSRYKERIVDKHGITMLYDISKASDIDIDFMLECVNSHKALIDALEECVRWYGIRHATPGDEMKDKAEQKEPIRQAMSALELAKGE